MKRARGTESWPRQARRARSWRGSTPEINERHPAAEVRERLAAEGAEVIGGTPEEFAVHIRSELARMKTLVREGGLRVE